MRSQDKLRQEELEALQTLHQGREAPEVRALLVLLRGQERVADKLIDIVSVEDLPAAREKRRVWRILIRNIMEGPVNLAESPKERRARADSEIEEI